MAGRLVLATLFLSSLVCGCERNPPPPAPNVGAASEVQTITGRERLGWDQWSPSPSDAAPYRFAIYVDGVRSEAADVSCAAPVGGAQACSGRLPVMAAGAHTLELATFVQNGSESARSAPLRVMVQSASAQQPEGLTWSSGPAGVTEDGAALMVERVAEGLRDPVDLAAAPDGRVFVAEGAGHVRVVSPGGRSTSTAVEIDGGELLGIAVDAQFARTHWMYALYAAAPATGGTTYRVARFREVAGTLGERAVLLNAIAPAARPPAGSLRALPDGHLLVAVSTGAAEPPSVARGMLLRYARDATAPRDQDGRPAMAAGLVEPHATWDAARGAAWVIDGGGDRYRLSQLSIPPQRSAPASLTSDLPAPGSAIAVYDKDLLPGFANDLLIGSPLRTGILRVQVQERAGSLSVTTERILRDRVGAVLALAVAANGAIYFATSDALGRITLAAKD